MKVRTMGALVSEGAEHRAEVNRSAMEKLHMAHMKMRSMGALSEAIPPAAEVNKLRAASLKVMATVSLKGVPSSAPVTLPSRAESADAWADRWDRRKQRNP
uniref:Uncharacterized protein n=1 Tax=Haptolina brevifila TaxID=156173 RepID=A0A7S2D2Q4_9EUKA|mmetsp:Transcript_32181/g.64190  ORF Transcript_32181/g.64190 Transcript_32181/m.64190 type:complete len:101 (+) Transcript_32181:1-303(+)